MTSGKADFTARPIEPHWPTVRDRIRQQKWAGDILAAIREDFRYWRDHLVIPGPQTTSAWTHHYFCGDDGSPLRFDPDSPKSHVCQHCGRVYVGEPWDGAWRTKMHSAATAQAQRASLLAQLATDPGEAADVLTTLLTTYATDYSSYELHGKNAGVGRVQPQGLDEAIWAIGLLRAARWAGEALSDDAALAAVSLARDVVPVLRPQVSKIHNIHCWMIAALAECAVRTADDELLMECRDGEFGAEAQIRDGFHPEGIWFEINAHYHYYTVSALLSYREASGLDGLSEEAAARLSRAITAPPLLAYDDNRLPAYADGWADCYVSTFAPQAEAAASLLPEHPIALGPYYDRIDSNHVGLWDGSSRREGPSAPLTGRSSVAALVFGPNDVDAVAVPPRSSFVWPDAGIGVLRSDTVRLAMRFGRPSGWHDHHDKLAVDLQTASGWSSLDLGTSGYGAEITQWMRSSVAHNLVILGGKRQPDTTGCLVEADDQRLVAEASWGEGVVRRALALTDEGWTDESVVTAPPGTAVEWVFHGDGKVALTYRPENVPTTLAIDDLGHGWLKDVRLATADDDGTLRLRWDAESSPILELPLPPGATAVVGVADANPNGLPLGVVSVRATIPDAGTVTFAATFLH